MSKHPTSLYGIPPAELGRQLAGLRYDALTAVLLALSEKLFQDSKADFDRGRFRLSVCLGDASVRAKLTAIQLRNAWEICEKFEAEQEKGE